MSSTIQIRTEATLKKNAQQVLEVLGLDMSTAINMYLVQIVQKGGIPFPILTENGMTPEAEQRLILLAEEARNSSKVYDSVGEMFADILNEDDNEVSS